MGINTHGARLLCYAKTLGVDYQKTATIARQGLALDRRSMSQVLRRFGYSPSASELDTILDGSEGYAEALLEYLGATQVESFDVSDYERATRIHDFNREIPAEYDGRYSVVLDSGSLEHIFDVRTAISNCARMVALNGHYICILPSNNFFGHGFYQFSPEFFYQVFSDRNGFELKSVIAFEDAPNRKWESARPNAPWYEVQDPSKLGERVTLVNSKPLSLIAIAKRVSDAPFLATVVYQSDYSAMWSEADAASAGAGASQSHSLILRIAKRVLPPSLRFWLRSIARRRPKPLGRGFERRFFRKLSGTGSR